jgi:hypothetical protein
MKTRVFCGVEVDKVESMLLVLQKVFLQSTKSAY